MHWSNAIGIEVVDTSTAEAIGHVDGIVIDPKSSSITGIVVGGSIAPWSETSGIGVDAVTIPSAESLREPATEIEKSAVAGDTAAVSKPVYTEDGFLIGDVGDIEFDAQTGVIGRLHIGDDDVAGSRLLGVGSFAVVVTSPDHASGAGDLGTLTKSELYDRAKEREIDGRSTMSKDELIDALG